MTIKELLKKELDAHPGGHCQVHFTHDQQHIECSLLEINALACAFDRLTVRDSSLADATIERLKSVSEKLAVRLTYLLEPIHPVEIDSEHCTVQLRSNPPHRENDHTSYYELIVKKPGQITLLRYRKQPGASRAIIPAEVTREVLGRLVGDLCQASHL